MAELEQPGQLWPSGLPTWGWEAAPVLLLERDLDAVMRFIQQVHQMLDSRALAAMINLVSRVTVELATGYGLDPQQDLQSYEALLREQFARPDWRMVPLDPEAMDLRLCAGGRMVECVQRDREPVLQAVPDEEGGQFSYPMTVGWVDRSIGLL